MESRTHSLGATATDPGDVVHKGTGTCLREAMAIERERASLMRTGRLHWVHWTAVIGSLIITIGAWQFSKQQMQARIEEHFEHQAGQAIELLAERMRKYEDALWSGAAAIDADRDFARSERWRQFADSLHIEQKYPGINGIGVIHRLERHEVDAYLRRERADRPDFRIHPPHRREELMPITAIEPVDGNREAVGLDMVHEENRYQAAKAARESGRARITAPIILVQDEARTPGFLLFVPFYEGGRQASPAARQRRFDGLVYAPFIVHRLMKGVLDKNKRQVRLSISDGDSLIYDEHAGSEPGIDPNPMFAREFWLDLYGRVWRFDIRTNLSFRAANESAQPLVVLICGLLIDSLLFLLFVLLTGANRKTLDFADRATQALRRETKELEQTNAELERFAYIASHDLKTPLRGVADLAEYIEEDLTPYLGSPGANPDVARNLDRIREQVRRMESLIKGILAYAQTSGRDGTAEPVDTAEVFKTLAEENGLRPGQLVFETAMPVLNTTPVSFGQVAANLIGNAVKHHPDREALTIRVGAQPDGAFYTFSVRDNGTGIDPQFHHRIFDMFETLTSRGGIESTGIGLSIVKKTVEANGGAIRVDSAAEDGATFTFDWPADSAADSTVRGPEAMAAE